MNRIKEVLKQKGIKQTWLAKNLGKSYNMINAYVQNRRQPSIHLLYQIAELLNVEANTLLYPKLSSINHVVYDEEVVKVPLLGTINCGIPILAEQNIEARVSISKKILNPNFQYFLLRALGDSMNKDGINDGALVLIRQQETAENGDNVVALIDGEATIKEFYQKENTIILKPKSTNNQHQPIILTENFKIQGVVEMVIKI